MRDERDELVQLLKQILAELRVLREDYQTQADELEVSRAMTEAT